MTAIHTSVSSAKFLLPAADFANFRMRLVTGMALPGASHAPGHTSLYTPASTQGNKNSIQFVGLGSGLRGSISSRIAVL
jgi:hypothetical protein